jgi:uncharacterized repeat protein (TIGR04052 family)
MRHPADPPLAPSIVPAAGGRRLWAFAWALSGLILPLAPAAAQNTTLQFLAEINGQAFECGRSYPLGKTALNVTPSDWRLFVSEVEFVRADGQRVPLKLHQDKTWQVGNVSLLDFENGQGPCNNGTTDTNTTIRGDLPSGDYRSLRFVIGVPYALNHADPTLAPSPLNTTAMFWNWQGGYKFIRFDTPGFPVHLGSTQCAAPSRTSAPTAPCGLPNRIEVVLEAFDARQHAVVLDLGRVLQATDMTANTPRTQPGCMSFPGDADCPALMGALGLPYDGQPPPGGQQLARRR